MQYLRYERSFVLLATRGRHEFFQREQGAIRDIRRVPIKFAGYSISCRKGRDGRWHASVRIRAEEYKNLKAYLVNLAAVGTRVRLTKEFDELCREPYAPVRRQLLSTLRAVNRVKARACLELVPASCLRLRRHVVQPFCAGR